MFANNNLSVLNFGFPDVCNIPTPVGPVPTPLVNLVLSITHIPSVFNVLLSVGLAENLLTQGTLSNGDQAGVLLGVASGTIMGPDHPITGSFKVFFSVAPGTRLTTQNTQNLINEPGIGISITPAQFKIILLG